MCCKAFRTSLGDVLNPSNQNSVFEVHGVMTSSLDVSEKTSNGMNGVMESWLTVLCTCPFSFFLRHAVEPESSLIILVRSPSQIEHVVGTAFSVLNVLVVSAN